jgi:hypothetical protein
MARSVAPSNPVNGQLITGAPFQSMIQGRGGFGDARGAVANYYVEESVGSSTGRLSISMVMAELMHGSSALAAPSPLAKGTS